MKSRINGQICIALACLIVAGLLPARPLLADQPASSPRVEAADQQTLLHVRIHRPLQVIENPWLQGLWQRLETSPAVRQQVDSLVMKRLSRSRSFLEKISGEPWRDALEKLTAGGIEFSLENRPRDSQFRAQFPFAALLTIEAADEKTLTRFVTTAEQARRDRSAQGPAREGAPQVIDYTYRDRRCTKVLRADDRPGEYFSTVGAWFLFTTDEKLLERLIDRSLATQKESHPATKAGATRPGEQPLVSFTLRPDRLREISQLLEAFDRPSDRLWLAPLADYRDAVRRSERIQGTLHLEESGLRLHLQCNAPADRAASSTPRDALPLLRLPDAVWSISLNRKLEKLWNDRNDWLSADTIRQVEEWDRMARERVAGLDVLQGIKSLGPHWRLMLTSPRKPVEPLDGAPAAQKEASVQQSPTDNSGEKRKRRRMPFPAVALAVDLKSEAEFRQRVLDPLEKFLGSDLGKVVGALKTIEYAGVRIVSFPLNAPPRPPAEKNAAAEEKTPAENPRETRAAAGDDNAPRRASRGKRRNRGSAVYRNFHPTYAVHRGQLLVGSTVEILKQTIDELEHESRNPPAAKPAATGSGEQLLSFARLAEHFRSRERILHRRLTTTFAVPEEQAQAEIAAFDAVLMQLGELSYHEKFAEKSLTIDIRLGPPSR